MFLILNCLRSFEQYVPTQVCKKFNLHGNCFFVLILHVIEILFCIEKDNPYYGRTTTAQERTISYGVVTN